MLSFAHAQIIPALPVTLTNGTLADANQVMSDFNTIVTGVNNNGAKNGANSDITSLSALSTPITPTQGGSSVYSGADSGSANAYVVAAVVPINFTLRSGNVVNFIPSFTNTGAGTLTTGGTATTAILKQTSAGLVPLVGGEIVQNQMASAIYDGTQYELLNSALASNVQPCTVIDYSGVTVPSGYLTTTGAAVSRTAFPNLFSCLAQTNVAATLNGTTTVTVPNSALFQTGWFVGGSNVTCNSTIQSIPGGGTTIVINNAAGASGSSTLTIGPYPQGDCATTFNLPGLSGRATVMADSTGTVLTTATCANPASVGSICGAQTGTITLANLPTGITSTGSQVVSLSGNVPFTGDNIADIPAPTTGSSRVPVASGGGLGSWASFSTISVGFTSTSNNTSGTAFPIVQPIGLVTKAIKF